MKISKGINIHWLPNQNILKISAWMKREGGGIELLKQQFVPSLDSLPSAAKSFSLIALAVCNSEEG